MKKTFALLLALVMALALVACGQKEDNIGGEKKDDQTQTDGQTVDLRAAYEAGIKQVQEELGDNAPVLLEETAVEILNSYYPGLENAKLKQSVFFISPTATSCEVSMVEAESAADAEIVRQSFQARVDAMADDTTYPRGGRHVEEQRHRYRQRQLCGAGGAARRLHRARRISGKILISYGVSPFCVL